MGYRLHQIDTNSKFVSELTLEVISRPVPLAEIRAVIEEGGVQETRERKLNMVAVVFLVITMSLYTHLSIGRVMQKLAQGLHYIWRDPSYALLKDNAITYRRYQLGARPAVALFHRVCRPIATPQTQGAFLFGLRLMAIDGTVEDVPDTPENVAAFGRHHGDRGDSAFPQVRGVYLVECGPHTIVDAGFWPCHTSERVGGLRMLRSVETGMLVMWDRGFHDFDMIVRTLESGSHALDQMRGDSSPNFLPVHCILSTKKRPTPLCHQQGRTPLSSVIFNDSRHQRAKSESETDQRNRMQAIPPVVYSHLTTKMLCCAQRFCRFRATFEVKRCVTRKIKRAKIPP